MVLENRIDIAAGSEIEEIEGFARGSRDEEIQ